MKAPLFLCLLLIPFLLAGQMCDHAISISCGSMIDGTTLDGSDHFDNNDLAACYSESDDYDSADDAYYFAVAERSKYHIYLTIAAASDADVDVFLLKTCDPPMCLNASFENNTASGIRIESIEEVLDPGTYYIIVDAKNSTEGSAYSIALDCSCTCTEPIAAEDFAEIVRCDNFDVYEEAALSPQSTGWINGSDAGVDASVDIIENNGYLQMNSGDSPASSAFYDMGTVFDGRYRFSWNAYISEGGKGVFEVFSKHPDLAAPNSVFTVELQGDGLGDIFIDNSYSKGFEFPLDRWFNIVQLVDLNTDEAELWVNHQFIDRWKYSEGIDAFSLSGIRFTGSQDNDFKVDDICIWKAFNSVSCNAAADTVCVGNLISFINPCFAAKRGLYTLGEMVACLTVCDFGGSFIHRTDEFDGTLQDHDQIPASLSTVPCILSAFGGEIPLDFRVEIKTFYNDDANEAINPILPQLGNNFKMFVFQCEFNENENRHTQQFLGEVGAQGDCAFNTSEARPVGLYYLVIAGLIGESYDLQVFPNADCLDFTEFGCSVVQRYSLTESNNFGSDTLGNYSRCYIGERTYAGNDIVFSFEVKEPTDVSIHFEAEDAKGIFLYNFLCARNCLRAAEVPESGGAITMDSLQLFTGRYYLIVDSEAGTDTSFFLGMQCQQDETFAARTFGIIDPESCPQDATEKQSHKVLIPQSASTLLEENTYLMLGYDDEGQMKTAKSAIWETLGNQVVSLPKDVAADPTKCAFQPNDSIRINLYTPYNELDYLWIQTTPEFAPFSFPSITGESTFLPGAYSKVVALPVKSQYRFEINPLSQTVLEHQDTLQILVGTNVGYEVIKDPAAWWLDVHYNSGGAVILVVVYPNVPMYTRSTDLIVKFHSEPVVQRLIHIEQHGDFSISTNTIQNHPVTLFPNPAGSSVFIRGLHSVTQYALLNLEGKVVMQGNFIGDADEEELNLQEKLPGIYFLSLTSGTDRWVRKLVIY